MITELISFEVIPRGESGWTSTHLGFGKPFTFLLGANGSGKTPLVRLLAYAMGYPVELTDAVRVHCAEVILELKNEKWHYRMNRKVSLDGQFVSSATNVKTNETKAFTSEGDQSDWFLSCLGFPAPYLLSKQSAQTRPYVSTIFPYLCVDQDNGWQSLYRPLKNKQFIQNQDEEMLRVLFNLSPKRSYQSHEAWESEKKKVEDSELRVQRKKNELKNMRQELGGLAVQDLDGLRQQRGALVDALRELDSGVDAIRKAGAVYDDRISEQIRRIAPLRSERDAVVERRAYLEQVAEGMGSEVQILEANLDASEAFRRFCKNEGCSLFKKSEGSYGRHLLYLKDQLKDLVSSNRSLSDAANALDNNLKEERDVLERLRQEKAQVLTQPAHSEITLSVKNLSHELAGVELKISRLQQFEVERDALKELIERWELQKQSASDLRPERAGKQDQRSQEVIGRFQVNVTEWLRILGARNLGGSVSISEKFELLFGDQVFSELSGQSGSTRTRIVLALHAAVLQTSLECGGNHPGFLILDAPKQHELSEEAFSAYIEKLRGLAATYGGKIQIVIALANLTFASADVDIKWEPKFTLEDGTYYLGPIQKPLPPPG